jgi:hypothetical protein
VTYLGDGCTCLAPGCEQTAVARGRCRRHYMAWYRCERAEQHRESQRRWRARVDYNAQRRKPKQLRACPVCEATFTTSSANNDLEREQGLLLAPLQADRLPAQAGTKEPGGVCLTWGGSQRLSKQEPGRAVDFWLYGMEALANG